VCVLTKISSAEVVEDVLVRLGLVARLALVCCNTTFILIIARCWLGYTAESTHTHTEPFIFPPRVACVMVVQLKLHSLGARLRPTSNASSFIILTNATSYSSQINQPVGHFYRVLWRRQPCGIFFWIFLAQLCVRVAQRGHFIC
jgi:hypothetical protein